MHRLAAFRTAASAGLGLAGASVATFLLSSCGSPGGPLDRARRALEGGRTHEAWTLAGEAVGATPNSAEAWLCRARAGLRTFRTAEAMAAADRAIALDSLRADAHLTRAYIFQRQFRNVAANKCADRAAELAPGEARMHVARGELHLGGGVVGTADYDVAAAAFREALRLDARSPRARLGLARTLVAQAQDEEAMTILDGFLADRPFHGEGHYLRGVVRMRNREMERAAVDFERAVRYLADPAPARFNLARVLDRLGKPEQALAARGDYPQARLRAEEIKAAELTWHEQPNLALGLRLAAGLRHAKRFDEGVVLTEALTIDFPKSASAFLELAEAAAGAGVPDVAARAAARAVELAPAEPRARVALIMATLAAGDTVQAVAQAEAAAKAVQHPSVRLALAEARLGSGGGEEAIVLARELGGNLSSDPRVPALMGRAQLAVGRHENATRALGNALALQPDVPEWLEARARAYAALNRADAAEADLRAAIALAPGRVSCHEALAEVLAAAKKGDEAKAARAERDRVREASAKIQALQSKWRERPHDLRRAAELADLLASVGRDAEAAKVWLVAEPEVEQP